MTILHQLSESFVEASEHASPFVLAVTGGTRFGASGVLWETGVCVTTRSTIRRDDKLRVTLPDGEMIPATLAGHDDGCDIAVLTFESPANRQVPSRPASAAAPRPGEIVLAIGRSENTGMNTAFGLVSAIGPSWGTWQGGDIDAYIRLDVALHPGGSGAAVINTRGELLGIVSGALSRIAPLVSCF